MPTTMKLIAKSVLGSAAADVTFSDIPGTYTDLLLIFSARTTFTGDLVADGVRVRFNGATSDTNHSGRWLYGSGSSVSSSTEAFCRSGYATTDNSTASTFASNEMYIPNYAGSTAKSYSSTAMTEKNATGADMLAIAGLWNSTSAITSMRLYPASGTNLKADSSFFLYGITKA